MNRFMDDALEGLEHYVRTGEEVDRTVARRLIRRPAAREPDLGLQCGTVAAGKDLRLPRATVWNSRCRQSILLPEP